MWLVSLNELMKQWLKSRKHVNECVSNLEWLEDSLVKVWRGHKGWSLKVLSMEVSTMTIVRDVCWFFKNDLNLGSLKDYLCNLEEGVCEFSSRIT